MSKEQVTTEPMEYLNGEERSRPANPPRNEWPGAADSAPGPADREDVGQ
jgi:hypothetical protein